MVLGNSGRNAGLNAVTALLNGGTLKIYTSGNTLLVTLNLSATAFQNASNGVAAANSISSGTAVADGTANYATLSDSSGNVIISAMTVGTADTEVVLDSLEVRTNYNVSISSLSITLPA